MSATNNWRHSLPGKLVARHLGVKWIFFPLLPLLYHKLLSLIHSAIADHLQGLSSLSLWHHSLRNPQILMANPAFHLPVKHHILSPLAQPCSVLSYSNTKNHILLGTPKDYTLQRSRSTSSQERHTHLTLLRSRKDNKKQKRENPPNKDKTKHKHLEL